MLNGISFTGRETMLTAGLKKPAKLNFFKPDTPSEMVETVAKEVKQVRDLGIESYVAAHQNILPEANSLAHDSAVTGENLHFFG